MIAEISIIAIIFFIKKKTARFAILNIIDITDFKIGSKGLNRRVNLVFNRLVRGLI